MRSKINFRDVPAEAFDGARISFSKVDEAGQWQYPMSKEDIQKWIDKKGNLTDRPAGEPRPLVFSRPKK